SLSDNKINSIEESPSGELWVGTEDGLNRFNPQTGGFFHYRKSDNGLNDTSVLSIHVSSDGTVWIGTGNGGLNKLNPVTGRFEYYRKRNGLPNNMVYGIVEDHQGKLWLSTNNGLCQFDPKLESYHNYYERDGLQSNEFNTGTFLKCRNGELAFGGPHGFNLFHPDKIKKNDHIPNIILTDFKVLNQDVPIGPDSPLERHISESNVIHLTHNDYEFSFEFAALDYYYSPANKYMVKLEGFDKEWVDPGNRRFKSYTTLDPGEYVFRVIGSNNDREWNKKGTSVRIIIKPPYWQTWWFQTFGGLFLVLLVLVLFRARTNSIRNRSKYLEEMNTKLNRHITERKKAEAQLKKSERRLRTFLETASEGFLEVNRQGIIMDVNPEMGSILGRKRQELMGRPIFNFIDPEGSKTVLHHMELRRAGERNSYELGMFKPDKSVVHCLINAAPLYDKEKKIRGSFAMVTDITDIIKAEEKLMRTKDYLNDVFDSLSSMLISVDRNGIITQWNRAAEKYIGIPANDAIAKKIWDVVPFLGDYRYHLGAVLESRQPVELHKESLSVSEKDKKFLDIFMYPLGYSDLEGVVIRLDDVTEMEKKDRQLIQAQKMEIVGNLAGGLAHDFNNVLGGILGTTSLLQFSFEMDDEFDVDKIKNRIDTIEKGAERAVDLVKQLLTLSRKREPTLTPVNLNQSLKNVLKICRNTFDKSIIITTHCVEEKAMVRADATQMEQVMLNLCINASHAMTLMRKDGDEPGGRLALSISPVYPDRIFRSNHPTATEDSYWSLEVEDTGVGIDAKTLDQVFDPFFTTKSERKGTGLGLAMVYHIVEQHHGVLAVYSEPGQGTTFQVLLPRAEGESVVLDIKKPEMTLVNGSGLILVVDDELNLRETSSEILASCGYRVMTAEDGEHGVSVYTEKHPEISAVLLDMAMPKMSGKEAYLEMKKINPAVKVLLTSGFKQDSRVMDVMNLGVKGFIQKPFSMVDLSRKMFDVVNS
ncbi:MAG: PAS domain S-box protein, partial [bacterium]|nr:PAS domain S-box protein [bacterium]